MIYNINAQGCKGSTIDLPTSKSISNRLLLINVLCNSPYLPKNLSESDDTRVMLEALRSDCSHVDVGAAGTSMRFMTAYLALRPGSHFITGSERMKKRPIALLVEALRSLGADIKYAETEGFPPLKIEGKELTGGRIDLPGNVSSQYISAIMMIAPMVKGGLTIHLAGKVISRPYILMTLKTMEDFGISCRWFGNTIVINEGQYKAHPSTVEADWSAASYWYAIAALTPGQEYQLNGLMLESLQGDSACVKIGKALGIQTLAVDGGIKICATKPAPERFDYDFNSQPDLAQTFVVLCCMLGTHFSFTGLESLRIKETDRISALIDEAAKLGYVLNTNGVDTLEWDGQTCPKSDKPIKTYKDHRMAMSFAPAAIKVGTVNIDDPMVVTKSYPNYWEDLKLSGFDVNEQ